MSQQQNCFISTNTHDAEIEVLTEKLKSSNDLLVGNKSK